MTGRPSGSWLRSHTRSRYLGLDKHCGRPSRSWLRSHKASRYIDGVNTTRCISRSWSRSHTTSRYIGTWTNEEESAKRIGLGECCAAAGSSNLRVAVAMASCKLWHCPSFSPLRSLSPSYHTSQQQQLLRSPRCGIRSTHQVNLSMSCHGDVENGRNGAVVQREDHDEEEEDGRRGIRSSVGAVHFGRREALAGFLVAGMLVGSPGRAGAYTQVEVGTYLPPVEDNTQYVQFKASTKDTPALRAGEFLLCFYHFNWTSITQEKRYVQNEC